MLSAGEVMQPLDERKKNRTVVFKDYLDYLRQGTETWLILLDIMC